MNQDQPRDFPPGRFSDAGKRPAQPQRQSAASEKPASNCSLAYGSLGTVYGLVGRTDEAIANQQIAIRSNPRDPSIFFRFSGLSLANYQAGRFDTAIEWAERAINRMPRWYYAHFVLAASHEAMGRHDQASEACRACLGVLPDIRLGDLDRVPLKDAEKMDEMRLRLSKAGFT